MGLFDKIKKKRFDVERELQEIRNEWGESPKSFRTLLENRIMELHDKGKHNQANELSMELKQMLMVKDQLDRYNLDKAHKDLASLKKPDEKLKNMIEQEQMQENQRGMNGWEEAVKMIFGKNQKDSLNETFEEFEERKLRKIPAAKLDAKNMDDAKEIDRRYEDYLRESGVFKGMTPEEAFESVSKARKEFFKRDDVSFTVNCGACGHLIAVECQMYDQQIQCPCCNSVNQVDRVI